MSALSINTVVARIEKKINSSLSVYPEKTIIFKGMMKNGSSIIVITPKSSLDIRSKGLVDFTQIQKNILDESDIALIAFRLPNEEVFFIDYNKLKIFLTNENMTYNNRAFEHWKLHIYPNEEIVTVKEKNNKIRITKDFNYSFENTLIIYPDDIEDTSLYEGTKKKITVNAYERSPQARQECINQFGYKCQICDFDFEKVYGDIGRDFIHVHHIVDISTIAENYKINPIKDLIPVCPNCHAMLHKRKPAYSPKEIKSKVLAKTYNKS